MKKPLLLIPALLCDEVLWQHQIAHLGDVADIVIADTFADDNITDMASRADQQMREAFGDEPYAVAGLSMGGYIALELMQVASDRISKLALLNTLASKESAEKSRRRKLLIATVKAHHRFHGMSDKQLSEYIHPDQMQNIALMTAIKDMTQRAGKDAFIRQQQAIIKRNDHTELLNQIAVPTLVITGEQDAITSPQAQRQMANAINGTIFVKIPSCGHLSTMEKPTETNILLRNWFTI